MPMALCCCSVDEDDLIIAEKEEYLQHLETLGLVRSPQPMHMDVGAVPEVNVTLNVYSLLSGGSERRLNRIGFGVFHCGVVVYGIEWGYGEALDQCQVTGLFCVHPGEAAGTLYRSIVLGSTTKSPMQVDTILHRMENEWLSDDYHILHHNCNNFAQAFLDLLTTKEKLLLPRWCNRAARVGDRVVPKRFATYIQRLIEEEPPKAKQPPRDSHVGELRASVIPRYWYLNPRIAQPLRYVIPDSHAPSQHFSTTLVVPPPGAGTSSRSGSVTRPGGMLRRSSTIERVHNDDDDIDDDGDSNQYHHRLNSADSASLSENDLPMYSPASVDNEQFAHSRSRKRPRLSGPGELQRENTMRPTPIATPLVKIETESAFGNAAATERGRSGSCASVGSTVLQPQQQQQQQVNQKPAVVMIPQPPQLTVPVSPRRQERATAKLLLTPIVVENNFTFGSSESATPLAQFTPSLSTPKVAQPSILTPRSSKANPTQETQPTPKVQQFPKPRRRAMSLDGAPRPAVAGGGNGAGTTAGGGGQGPTMRYSHSISGISPQMAMDAGEESAFVRNVSSQYFQDVDSFELIPRMRRPRHLQSVAPSEDDENGEGSGADDNKRKRKDSKRKSVSEAGGSGKRGLFGSKSKSTYKNKKKSNKNKKQSNNNNNKSGVATPTSARRHFHRCRRHEREYAEQLLNASNGKTPNRPERQGKGNGSQRGGKSGRSTSKDHSAAAETPRRGLGSLLRSFASSFIASRSPSTTSDDNNNVSRPRSMSASSCSCCTCSYDYSYSCTSSPSFASTFIDYENPSVREERGSSVDANSCSCSCPAIEVEAAVKPPVAGATPALPPLPLPTPPGRLPSRARTRAGSSERQSPFAFATTTPCTLSDEPRNTTPHREKNPVVTITTAEETGTGTGAEATSKPEKILDKMSLWKKAKIGVLGESKPSGASMAAAQSKKPDTHPGNGEEMPHCVTAADGDENRAAVKDNAQNQNADNAEKDDNDDAHHGAEDSVFFVGDKMLRVQASTEAGATQEEMSQFADGLVSGKREQGKAGKPGVGTKLLGNLLSKVGQSNSSSLVTPCDIQESSPTTGVTSSVRDVYAEKSSPVRVNRKSHADDTVATGGEASAFPDTQPQDDRSGSIDSAVLNADTTEKELDENKGEKIDRTETTSAPKETNTTTTCVDVPKWRSTVGAEGGTSISATPAGDARSQRKSVAHKEGCRHYHPTSKHAVPGARSSTVAPLLSTTVDALNLQRGTSVTGAPSSMDGSSIAREPKRRHHRHIHRHPKRVEETENGTQRRRSTTGGGASKSALGTPDRRTGGIASMNGVTPLGKPPSHPPTRNISSLINTPKDRRQSTPLLRARSPTPPLAPRRMSVGNSPILSLTTTQVFSLPIPSGAHRTDDHSSAVSNPTDAKNVTKQEDIGTRLADASSTTTTTQTADLPVATVPVPTAPSKDTPIISAATESESGPRAAIMEETRLPAQADITCTSSEGNKVHVRVVAPQRRVSNLSNSSVSAPPTPFQSRSSPVSHEHHLAVPTVGRRRSSSSANNSHEASDTMGAKSSVPAAHLSTEAARSLATRDNSPRRTRRTSETVTDDMNFSNTELTGAVSTDVRERTRGSDDDDDDDSEDDYEEEPLTQAAKVQRAHPRLRGGNGDRSNVTDLSADVDLLSMPTSYYGPLGSTVDQERDASRISPDLVGYGSTYPTEMSVITEVVPQHVIEEQMQAGAQIVHWGMRSAADDDMRDAMSSDEEGWETEPASLNGDHFRVGAIAHGRFNPGNSRGLGSQNAPVRGEDERNDPSNNNNAEPRNAIDVGSATSETTNEQQNVDGLPTSPLVTQHSEDAGNESAGNGTFDSPLLSQEEEKQEGEKEAWQRSGEQGLPALQEIEAQGEKSEPAPIATTALLNEAANGSEAHGPLPARPKEAASAEKDREEVDSDDQPAAASRSSSELGDNNTKKENDNNDNNKSGGADASSKRHNFTTKALFTQAKETQDIPQPAERRQRRSLDSLAKTTTDEVNGKNSRLLPTSLSPQHPSARHNNHHHHHHHNRTHSADARSQFEEKLSASMPVGIETSRNRQPSAEENSQDASKKSKTSEAQPEAEQTNSSPCESQNTAAPREATSPASSSYATAGTPTFLTVVNHPSSALEADNPLQVAGAPAVHGMTPAASAFFESMSGDYRFYNAGANIGRSAHVVSTVGSAASESSPSADPSLISSVNHTQAHPPGSPPPLSGPRPFNVSHARSLSLSASLPNGVQVSHPNEVVPEGGGAEDGAESHSLNSTNHGLNEPQKLSTPPSVKDSNNE